MGPITDEAKEIFLRKKHNSNIISVGDTIMTAEKESGINNNWCLLENESTCNTFVYWKHLLKSRDSPDGKKIYFCCNTELIYTNKIGDLPGY